MRYKFMARGIESVKKSIKIICKRCHFFTLIELLVVIAIIAILSAMLLPVLNKARDKANEITCINQERQLIFAMKNYLDSYNEMFPDVLGTADAGLLTGWNYFDSRPTEDVLVGDISRGVLYPFVLSKKIYVCPSVNNDTNCSYAMNSYLENSRATTVKRSDTLVFLEEARPNATNDGCYIPGVDPISKKHSGKGVFAAIDGHVSTGLSDTAYVRKLCSKNY